MRNTFVAHLEFQPRELAKGERAIVRDFDHVIAAASIIVGEAQVDAITVDGKKVQVKANYAASQIGFRGDADMLLCLKIDLNGDWTEIFYGDFALVKQAARYSARDNKHMVAVSALIKIAKAGYVLPEVLPIPEPKADVTEPI